ncbi:sporulation protein YhbH [Pullulanibacillus pueri]|uniref:Stress response UPF0229 protein YhbH n=1 Tax=Pullulanibacillus pueri TaxID=1437324 RepID=A0A8J2ZXI0_9BACL|nr:sporulation protein YhbH [Pullulanibacillus pueri]MBM7683576.1 sporulation protein YhbH [Pullulanibacillus pueri]GGH84485.1 stress response UPF0229 protein YhbH [Pullulanibacillus pueri]
MKDFHLSFGEWDMYHKANKDQQRHKEKVEQAIKDNLPDLLSEESIIMSDGQGLTRLPIRSLDEYKLRYGSGEQSQVGQGDGDSQVGDVLEKLPPSKSEKGNGADSKPGIDYYEENVSLEDIEEHLYKELELPDLEQKDFVMESSVPEIVFRDIRKKGLMGNLDKRRTLLQALKRNAISGKGQLGSLSEDDLRFKTWENIEQPESRAVVFAMMDTSGSMGMWEKYMARSFFFWMKRFLETNYKSVEIVYLAHHTEARLVTESEFFSKGESGGTICSSVYQKALDLIEAHYSPASYNIYPVHFSDGDNLSSDTDRCIKLVQELTELSALFAYGEINPYGRKSTLMEVYQHIDHEKNRCYVFKDKKDIYYALKHFFSKNGLEKTES